MNRSDPAIQFLLNSPDPSIRYLTLTDLLDASPRSREVVAARKAIPDGARVKALLTAPGKGKRTPGRMFATHPGGFGVHPYKKVGRRALAARVARGIGNSGERTACASFGRPGADVAHE